VPTTRSASAEAEVKRLVVSGVGTPVVGDAGPAVEVRTVEALTCSVVDVLAPLGVS
jgi:hypothetical protein